MSGLFLNLYTIEVSESMVEFSYLNYDNYSTKEAFKTLQKDYSDVRFYRFDDKILILSQNQSSTFSERTDKISLNLKDNAKVLSKIIENGIVDFAKKVDIKFVKINTQIHGR